MKKLLLSALLVLTMLFLGTFESVTAQETRINNPWIKGKIKFQNGYYIWDSTSNGVKINGSFYLQDELWINSFLLKDSAGYVIFNKTPKFPISSGWIYDGYIVSLNGSKILDSTITLYKLHPDLLDLIFRDTINVKGLTSLYNELKTRYDLLHDINGNFKISIFSGVIKYSNLYPLMDPGKIYLNIGSTLDTTGGVLNVYEIPGSVIRTGTITSIQIGDTSVSSSKIKNNVIDSTKILNGSIANNDLAVNSVGEINIQDNAVSNSKILNSSITEDKIRNNSISTSKIIDGSIVEQKIANNAVTEKKIYTGAVTTTKIADGSITEEKIADDAVTEGKIYTGAVTTSKIADGNVAPEKLDTSKIKGAKIINDTLCISTFISWLSRNHDNGQFIERSPTTGEDVVGYSFPRKGKIISITIWDGNSYRTEICNLYFQNSDYITIKLISNGSVNEPHIFLGGIDTYTIPYGVTNEITTQFTLEVVIY